MKKFPCNGHGSAVGCFHWGPPCISHHICLDKKVSLLIYTVQMRHIPVDLIYAFFLPVIMANLSFINNSVSLYVR